VTLVADSKTDNTTAFQALLDDSAGKVPVRIGKRGSGFYKLTGRVTAPAHTHIILEDGAELRWTSTTVTGAPFLDQATRPGIEIAGDDFVIEGNGILRGPSVDAYVLNECALFAKGANTAARKRGLTVRGAIEIVDWGSYGVLAQFVDDVSLEDARTRVHGIGYAGAMFASCNHGRVRHVQVGDIAPGTAGNAYGISLSHDSRDYSSDPHAGTRWAAHPFCQDWIIDGCTIYDVPQWRGLDAHGGYEVHFRNNEIYNCGLPIGLCSSSGDAINYAGADNSVVSNKITRKRRDGSATQVTANVGAIIVNGGSTARHRRVTVIDNEIDGYGASGHRWHSIAAVYCTDALIVGNRISDWAGYGIYSYGGNGFIADNVFGPVSEARGAFCIRLDARDSGEWSVLGNRHHPPSGMTAAEGLRISSGSPRCIVHGNDFDGSAKPYVDSAATWRKDNSQPIPRIQVSGTPTTIDVGPAGKAGCVWIECSLSGAATVTDLRNARLGVTYILQSVGAGSLAFEQTHVVIGRNDTLVLMCAALSGTKFVALGGANVEGRRG
jgi:hypothetical protein